MDKNFVLVHNGIIENFREIKQILKNEDFKFNTETDTEIIANLLEYNFKKVLEEKNNDKDKISSIKCIIKKLYLNYKELGD